MGSGRWSPQDWQSYSRSNIFNKSSVSGAGGIYSSSSLVDALNPKGVVRESRDSADNPNSTPIIIGLDVTGSMSHVLDAMARKGLPTLAEEIYKRQPVSDPHILCAGIGDALCDRAPLQVTQFEADIRIAEQLTKIWLEEGGGGNGEEGYALLWYFADRHTSIDSMLKRNKKGYLFTVGNDGPTRAVRIQDADRVFGDKLERDLTGEEILKAVSRSYEVFHLHLADGHSGYNDDQIMDRWKVLLGERAIRLTDHTKMGEVIVSLLEVLGGKDKQSVVQSWNGSTQLVVLEAIKDITTVDGGNSGGLVTL